MSLFENKLLFNPLEAKLNLSKLHESIIREHSKKYYADIELCRSNFENSVSSFLMSDVKKCLLLETKDSQMGAMRIMQKLEQMKNDFKNEKVLKNYLMAENQTFVRWEEFRNTVGLAEDLPRLTNLFVCEFPYPVTIETMHKKILNNIIDGLNTIASKKVIFVTSQQHILDEYFKGLSMQAFLSIDEFKFKVTSMFYANNTEALVTEASKGNSKEVLELIKEGVDVNVPCEVNRSTALQEAAKNGKKDVVQILLENGAQIIPNNFKDTPLHVAARNGYANVVEAFLKHGIDVNIKGECGETALHAAAKSHKEVVSILLKYGAYILPSESKDTALHVAARNGEKNVVRILLEHGVDVNIMGRWKQTALHDAAFHCHSDVVKMLLQYKTNINAQTFGGLTALHMAADENHIEIVQILLSNNASILPDKSKNTPVHLAARKGHKDVVLLLLKNNVDINFNGGGGWTPLHEAVFYGHNDLVLILLKHNANINALTPDGSTPLHMAADKKHEEIVRTLLKSGAQILPNNAMETPLHLATKSGGKKGFFVVSLSSESSSTIAKDLLKFGANVNAQTDKGLTAMHAAAENADIEMLKMLLNSGADINAKDNMQNTPLHAAGLKGHLDIVKFLIEKGADVNARNMNNKTAMDLVSDWAATLSVKVPANQVISLPEIWGPPPPPPVCWPCEK